MKIDINQILTGGSLFEEDISARSLDLETENIRFKGPIHIRVEVSRITNAVTADINIKAVMLLECCRCLKELEVGLDKKARFNYVVEKTVRSLDLGPDIREEIVLGYPLKPLCSELCKGLCPKCGKNLNEGGCSCATT